MRQGAANLSRVRCASVVKTNLDHKGHVESVAAAEVDLLVARWYGTG